MASSQPSGKGYLIALLQEGGQLKAYGSPADRNDCDEILEINGEALGTSGQHGKIVAHIHECIKLRNISLKVKRAPFKINDDIDSSLLDVFVIGSNAQQQLERFFKITNSLASPQDLLKLTSRMEMLELNNANPAAVASNGNFINQQIIGGVGPQSQLQQISTNQAHLYLSHQQQQQQALRYNNITNQKVSKHRELPVDVPDSFVGQAKQSPRYPPPKSNRQVSPPMPLNSLTTFNNTPSSMPINANSNANQQQNKPPQQQQPAIPALSQNTAANILTHNNSLRSSIKLKQLEKSRASQHGNYLASQMQPAINQAFELNEDDVLMSVPTQQATSHQQQPTMNDDNAAANSAKQALKLKQSMPDLCSIYNRLQRNLNGEFTDASGDAKFPELLSIFDTIVQTHKRQLKAPVLTSKHATTFYAQGIQEPTNYKTTDLLQSVYTLLKDEAITNDTAELLNILCKHQFDGVCSAFDRIAPSFEYSSSLSPSRSTSPPTTLEMVSDTSNMQQHPPMYKQQDIHHQYPLDDYDYAPDPVQMDFEYNPYQHNMHPLTDIDLSDGTCTKIVRIEKSSNQALGATIKNEEDGSVVIGRIVCGGAADMSGLLREGDEILEVNGVQMRGKNINEVVNILERMNETLTFTVVSRNYNKPPHRNAQEKIVVRAFFKFDGENDAFIPCKELGLSFEKGEILTIIDQSDPKWWQARTIEGDSECRLAGLIPSVNFLKQREKELNQDDDITTDYLKNEKKHIFSFLFDCPRGSSPRRRKKLDSIPFAPDEIPYYEEVCPYYPVNYCKRPIILVGPKMIGLREIVDKLIQTDPSRFAAAIPSTTEPTQDHNRFHVVSRAQFEADKYANKFIESGLYQNHYYGTSIEAMKEVIRSKRFCIHQLNTSSLINFRQGRAGAELKPFFVYPKPDDTHPEKLRNIVAKFSPPKSNIEENMKAVMAEVDLIETHYLPFIDLVIADFSDVDRACQELLCEIDKIEKDPQWIPRFWQNTIADR